MYDGIKAELHMMVFVSGGILFLVRPYYLIMLAPIYAQKLFSNSFGNWGINIQYSIEFAPLITLCIIDFFSTIKKRVFITVGLITICASTIFFTYRTLETRKSKWYLKQNAVFYLKEHYQTSYDVANIYEQIFKIPKKAIVSTCGNLAPHLALRDKIYLFPKINDSDYVALLKITNTYPYSQEQYTELLGQLRTNTDFTIWYENEELIIFNKIVQ